MANLGISVHHSWSAKLKEVMGQIYEVEKNQPAFSPFLQAIVDMALIIERNSSKPAEFKKEEVKEEKEVKPPVQAIPVSSSASSSSAPAPVVAAGATQTLKLVREYEFDLNGTLQYLSDKG